MLAKNIKVGITPLFFLGFFIVATLFIVSTSQTLPPLVASHFGLNGQANNFMSRADYEWFMVGIIFLLSIFVSYLPILALKRFPSLVNLPNKQYWLSPERFELTVTYLRRYFVGSGYISVGFIMYIHWLVVYANRVNPPLFSFRWVLAGLFILMGCIIIGSVKLICHFSRAEN